jgi:hypothetical protein
MNSSGFVFPAKYYSKSLYSWRVGFDYSFEKLARFFSGFSPANTDFDLNEAWRSKRKG